MIKYLILYPAPEQLSSPEVYSALVPTMEAVEYFHNTLQLTFFSFSMLPHAFTSSIDIFVISDIFSGEISLLIYYCENF